MISTDSQPVIYLQRGANGQVGIRVDFARILGAIEHLRPINPYNGERWGHNVRPRNRGFDIHPMARETFDEAREIVRKLCPGATLRAVVKTRMTGLRVT